MLKISQGQYQALGHEAGRRFVDQLSAELHTRFPERFGLWERAQVVAFVQDRIGFARARGLTRENDVAILLRSEAQAGEDFTAVLPGHPVHAILSSDHDGAVKAHQLHALLNGLETAPGFVPSEHD